MSRGADRERAVARLLRADGWAAYTTKNDGQEHEDKRFSHGIVDVVAVRVVQRSIGLTVVYPEVRLIQVKSTSGPYERFGPDERAELLSEAKLAGSTAELWHWPKNAREPRIINSSEWPAFREIAA